MAPTYLIGGKTLEGVKEINQHEQANTNTSSFSFSSDSSIASSSSSHISDNSNSLTLRRLGLDSSEFDHRLLLEAQNHQGFVTELDASRNQITAIPDTFSHPVYHLLTYLNLSCNNLSSVPPPLLCLSHLQHLNLSENQIDYIPADMPSCLSHLLVLTLDSNQIQTLPDTINQWNHLRELRFGSEYGGNRIIELPNLSDMCHLVELDLSFNQIDTIAPHTFDGLSCLSYLNLSHNQLRRMPMLKSCHQLSTLDLSDNRLTEVPLANVERLMRLQLLNLSNNLIEALPTQLLDQEMQTQVVIKGNPIASFEYHYQLEQEDNNAIEESSMNTRLLQVSGTLDVPPIFNTYTGPSMTVEKDNSALSQKEIASKRTPVLLHSLREISLRTLILNHNNDITEMIPEHIAQDIRNQLQCCLQCSKPFVHEWVTSLQRKSYRSYGSMARQVRFCSTRCWQEYRDNLEQQALAVQSQVTHPSQQQGEAMQFIAQHPQAMEPTSVDWIMAAVMASSAQEEQADILANYHMFF